AAQASDKFGTGLNAVNDNAKLSSYQLLNLSRQGNDVITMFALGANPMQIFASQAGQVYDALAGEAGLVAGFNKLKNSAKAALASVVSSIGLVPSIGLGLAAVGVAG